MVKVLLLSIQAYVIIILLENDPGYLANLHGFSLVERERLLNSNWKIRLVAFKREQTRIVKAVPENIVAVIRAWDLAATEINLVNKDPDRTAGVLMARMSNGQYIILDAKRIATNAANVRSIVNLMSLKDFLMHCMMTKLTQQVTLSRWLLMLVPSQSVVTNLDFRACW